MTFPVAVARVVAHNPPWGMQVQFKTTGQSATFPVIMGRGYADALRVKQAPLPGVGTWGLVLFPYGDVRNGVWITSFLPSQMDALTGTASGAISDGTDPFIDYEAHFSGYWYQRDGMGNFAEQWPDGSYMVAASGETLPTVYRHIVEDNKQKQVEFKFEDRIPTPPSPFVFNFVHKTGTSIKVDTDGAVIVSGLGGTVLTVAADGTANIDLASGKNLNITQGGAPASDFLTLVSKLMIWLNSHIHTGVSNGGDVSGPPSIPAVPSDLSSDIIGISG